MEDNQGNPNDEAAQAEPIVHAVPIQRDQMPPVPQRGRLLRQVAVGFRNQEQATDIPRVVSYNNSETAQDNAQTILPSSNNPMVRGVSYVQGEADTIAQNRNTEISDDIARRWINMGGNNNGRDR